MRKTLVTAATLTFAVWFPSLSAAGTSAGRVVAPFPHTMTTLEAHCAIEEGRCEASPPGFGGCTTPMPSFKTLPPRGIRCR